MDLRTIAEHLNRISTARGEASTAMGECVRALFRAFVCFDRAHGAAKELDDARALAGSQAEELRELRDYLQMSRAVVGETAFAAANLHSNSSQFIVELESMASAAREGMQAKHLANWETEALREIVVKTLAGEPNP
jgi:hypothetical protein